MLSGRNFCFVATADYRVQNIKVNGYLKAGSGSSVNIDLGILSGGYHLLEFEFVDVSGGGVIYRWWTLYLKDYTIDAYSLPNLDITGMEADTGDNKGKINTDLTIALDFEGTILMTISSLLCTTRHRCRTRRKRNSSSY